MTSIGRTSSLQDEVFDTLIGSIFVGARIKYFAIDSHCLFLVFLLATGDVENIFVAQGDIWGSAFQYTTNIHAQYFQRAVCSHAVHDGML